MSLEISQQASSSDAESIPQPSPPLTAAVSIKLPPYWSNDPALWFSQVEAQFTTRGITSETTKYAHVVGSLQPEVAQEVRDLLINPPAENPYIRLKSELVKRTSASEQQRLHQLLNAEQLGDRKPTQLLRRMQQLLGERQLEPSIMTQLFLQRLPTNAQAVHLSLVQGHFGYGKFGEAGRQDPGSHTNSLHNPNPLHRSSTLNTTT